MNRWTGALANVCANVLHEKNNFASATDGIPSVIWAEHGGHQGLKNDDNNGGLSIPISHFTVAISATKWK